MPDPQPPKRTSVTEAEEIELEFKRLQIELMKVQVQGILTKKEGDQENRRKMIADMRKAEAERLHRQRICKHRKGGRNNNFAKGDSANYSIIQNTYPMGDVCISCTRCGKEVWRPSLKLRKTNPKLYQSMLEEWQLFSSYPTDNSPSGSKIFEVVEGVA